MLQSCSQIAVLLPPQRVAPAVPEAQQPTRAAIQSDRFLIGRDWLYPQPGFLWFWMANLKTFPAPEQRQSQSALPHLSIVL